MEEAQNAGKTDGSVARIDEMREDLEKVVPSGEGIEIFTGEATLKEAQAITVDVGTLVPPAEKAEEAEPPAESAPEASAPSVESPKDKRRVFVLLATIPSRRRSCDRILEEITHQSMRPDAVLLVLDGYVNAPAPYCSLPSVEVRTDKPTGPGNRWRVAENLTAMSPTEALVPSVILNRVDLSVPLLRPDDILINLDDDVMLGQAPKLIEKLVLALDAGEADGLAAAVMGRQQNGKSAPPGARSYGDLIYGAGCGLAVRARHLVGVQEFSAYVRAKGGPDSFGPLGDDDALVSAHLWKQGVRIAHVAVGVIHTAPGMQATSQTQARLRSGQKLDAQRRAIKSTTGWPWPVV